MRQRIINFRPTFPLVVFEPVAGNYYPINSAAYIRDASNQLNFVTDRSQGVGSVTDGEIEVMLHRRILLDDYRGVDEPLNEIAFGTGLIIRSRHYVFFDTIDKSATIHRTVDERLSNPLLLAFAPASSIDSWKTNHITSFSALANLPPQVHLQTLQALPNKQFLLRLAHMYETGESSIYSVPVQVDLSTTFFPLLQVTNATEMTLSANQPLQSSKRVQWDTTSMENIVKNPTSDEVGDHYIVTLNPMQIKTFVLF